MKITHALAVSAIAAAALASTVAPVSAAGTKYMALGDSYVSGPGIATQIDKTCERSDHNYAHLFAAQRGYALTDVSCGGATIDTVTSGQLPSVTADADLITLGISGNDIGFGEIVQACALAGNPLTTGSSGAGQSCKAQYADKIPGRIQQASAKLDTLLAAIRQQAPHAHIVLVGYPKTLPDNAASCAGVESLRTEDIDWLRDSVGGGLNTMLRGHTGNHVEYVSLWEVYTGHDICAPAADRWVNGTKVLNNDGTLFHPNHYGHIAAAQQLESSVGA